MLCIWNQLKDKLLGKVWVKSLANVNFILANVAKTNKEVPNY